MADRDHAPCTTNVGRFIWSPACMCRGGQSSASPSVLSNIRHVLLRTRFVERSSASAHAIG
uniref:Terminase n=1 Tax=uncultured marine virus TaxID=186617 RepID=A0A0F7L8R4_9VIRU|nr:terminase [uncultured marine virus]